MAKKSKSKKIFYFSITRLIVFILLCSLTIGGGLLFQNQLSTLINGEDATSTEVDYDGLVVHYLNVGQADCILIDFPDDKTMLIDSGESDSKNIVVEYLNNALTKTIAGEKIIDYVLLTHSDSDHSGNMKTIMDTYKVNNVFRPQIYIDDTDKARDSYASSGTVMTVTTKTYQNAVNSFYAEENCTVRFTHLPQMNTDYKISGGEGDNYYELKFYTPQSEYYANSKNNYSPIFTINYRNKKLMFTGDAESANETEFLSNYADGKVDVLKVSHHGSRYCSSAEFLNAVKPSYSIISCANTEDHPHQELLNRLNYINSTILRTNEQGNIIVNITTENKLNIVCNNLVGRKKIDVKYILIGAGIVELYFCFFVKYSSNLGATVKEVSKAAQNVSNISKGQKTTKKTTKTKKK